MTKLAKEATKSMMEKMAISTRAISKALMKRDHDVDMALVSRNWDKHDDLAIKTKNQIERMSKQPYGKQVSKALADNQMSQAGRPQYYLNALEKGEDLSNTVLKSDKNITRNLSDSELMEIARELKKFY